MTGDAAAPRVWTLRRRLGSAIGTLTVVLAVLTTVVVLSAVRFSRSGDDVINRWQPALQANDRVLLDLVDQETGLRGYALTANPAYLQPYRAVATAQIADAAQLRRLAGSDGRLRTLVSALDADVRAWRDHIAGPSVRAIASGSPTGRSLVASATAKAFFDRIRAGSAAVRHTIDTRTAAARDARRRDGVEVTLALGLLVLVVLASGWVLWRGLHRWVLGPVGRLGAQTRTVASGERTRAIVPDGPDELLTLGGDVEAMRQQIGGELARANAILDELRLRTEELARSNEDLQQFAYVASHDLSEPLRKVANFCQLLERQYAPQLDDRARQYIDFAVDGAKRMQVLITDLLALSRVGRTTDRFVPVDLDAAFGQAMSNLGDRITTAGATVTRETPLPTVGGDRSLLTSLLENLVGNAVKYRRDDVPPQVTVRADLADGTWTFTVRDNGIGIDPQYAERIFAVFQRLHLRDQYGGTGIGLALCRRIVEFHGGQIWLETDDTGAAVPAAAVESGRGATFRFTLPEGGRRAQPRD